MRMTVLEMVQDIATALGSDPITTLGTTAEAVQIQNILVSTYNELLNERDWFFQRRLITLQSVNQPATNPTTMLLPANSKEVYWVKHNRILTPGQRDNFYEVQYVTPEEFIYRTNIRDERAAPYSQLVDPIHNVTWKVRTDIPPTFWTSFDQQHIIFDSYNSSLADSILSVDTLCYASMDIKLEMQDNFIPGLPPKLFPLLLATAKVYAFQVLKGESNALLEREVKRLRVMLQHDESRVEDLYGSSIVGKNETQGVIYGRT